jgi:hypothetical protein
MPYFDPLDPFVPAAMARTPLTGGSVMAVAAAEFPRRAESSPYLAYCY